METEKIKVKSLKAESWPNPPFYYNYDKGEYQLIYVGEFFGTTFIMAADLQQIEKDNKKMLIGSFVSKNVGGTIKFAIAYVARIAVRVEEKKQKDKKKDVYYKLEVKLSPFTNVDQDRGPIAIKLDEQFEPNHDRIRINIQNDDILGLNDSQIFFPKEEINNERSCDIQ
ncbi:MAG: hypothetical protein AAF717_15960 [Bacteroidota bacterium]